MALESLGQLAQRVQRAMDTAALAPGDAFEVATALWACYHGLVSLEARDEGTGVFDWDRVADVAIDAVLRGLAAAPGAGRPPDAPA